MSGISSPRVGCRLSRWRALAWGAALLLLPSTGLAQGRWIDIGANQSYQIPIEGDPLSFEFFPALAFGPFLPGNRVYVELLRWPCISLPDVTICTSGRLLGSYYGYLETGICPCGGQLVEPITVQVHYDSARVLELGGREVDLSLRGYDEEQQAWTELGSQTIDPGQDLVAGRHAGNARQYYVLVLSESPRAQATWGRIKDHWSGS
jgi:hypothetical protein